MHDLPATPATPRNGRPAYIAPDCPTCRVPLVCLDPDWADEWDCPTCGATHLDAPRDYYEMRNRQIAEEPNLP